MRVMNSYGRNTARTGTTVVCVPYGIASLDRIHCSLPTVLWILSDQSPYTCRAAGDNSHKRGREDGATHEWTGHSCTVIGSLYLDSSVPRPVANHSCTAPILGVPRLLASASKVGAILGVETACLAGYYLLCPLANHKSMQRKRRGQRRHRKREEMNRE